MFPVIIALRFSAFLSRGLIVLLSFTIIQSVSGQAPVITSFTPDSVGTDGTVRIFGHHFSAANKVTFGGRNAYYFYATTDTTINAFCGEGNTGYVAVYTAQGVDSMAGITYVEGPEFYSFAPMVAQYGDTISIRGKNFYNMEAVYFGDSAAFYFQVLNDSIIKAVVPNGTSGEIYAWGDFGETFIGGFIYLGPAISSFSPTAGVTGSEIKIWGTNFNGTTNVLFGNEPAASYIVNSNTLITATMGVEAAGLITVTTPFGSARIPHFNSPVIINLDRYDGTRYDTINITGYNFTGVTAVNFGDSLAHSFTIVSDSLIKAVLGNGASGSIKVTRDSISFTVPYISFYYNNYAPSITSFTPTSGTEQTEITIVGNQFIGTSAVSFGGRPADSFVVVSNTLIKATVGIGNSGAVTVTTNNITASLSGFNYVVTPPQITAVTPASGPVGSLAVITGIGFNVTAAGNTVYFGGVKANVTAASRTSLTVAVPAGAGYFPVSITNNGNTGYSRNPFRITFPGALATFSATSFDAPLTIRTTGSNPAKMAQADFDNDGKVDIAIVYGYYGTANNIVSVYRNTSANEIIHFADAIEYPIGSLGSGGADINTTDIDGDGKLDLLCMSGNDNIIGIFKNTSTNGAISFADKIDIITSTPDGPDGTSPATITTADFDNDGKPDLAIASVGIQVWSKVTYIRNTSQVGNISFGTRSDFRMVDTWRIATGHLNSDHKPDIAVGIGSYGFYPVAGLLNNQSIPGTISFQQNEYVGPGTSLRASKIAFADLDEDGKMDMVVASGNASNLSLYKNVTVNDSDIVFAAPLHLNASPAAGGFIGLSISDADGDGKPDLMVASTADTIFTVFKNLSSVDNLLFATGQAYTTGFDPVDIMTADLNGDGKPDLVTTNSGDTTISIFRNNIGGTIKLCPPVASTVINAGISGGSYQWQVNTGNNVFTNISNGTYYSGTSTGALQLTNIPSSFTGYQYQCLSNGTLSNKFSIQFVNTWLGSSDTSWNNPYNWSCGTVPDASTDVIINTGNVIIYSNVVCRTLTVLPGAVVTVATGNTLTITH